MIRLFEAQVAVHGEDVALRDSVAGIQATWRDLDEGARRVAAKLMDAGFRTGDAALITVSRGIGFIEAMLGVMMAGGAYVPLSDHYPQDRIEYIQGDCGAKICVDDAFIRAAAEVDPLSEPVEREAEDVVLIAYTSGSTGKPKGILHDDRGLVAAVRRYATCTCFRDGDVYGINGPFYFILHIMDVFAPLLNGVPCELVPEALRGDPEGLSDFIDARGITVVFISPKVLRYFRKKGERLRCVMTGSERVAGIAPVGFELINLYGMTETACAVTAFRVDRAYDNTPIGKPMPGVGLYLLDGDGRPADEGEICVSGLLGRGYLNLPEQTAVTFVANPFREEDGFETLIRTGDLGRRLPDGNIVYVNRRDWMVKINGQRVEPGEIEAMIRDMDGIADATVRDFIDAAGQTFLAAYYIADREWDEAALKAALAGKLPEYMIPASFTRLERFPVNANGKLNRGALPKPDLGRRRAAYAAPENPRQQRIVEAYEAVLGMEHIGIDDEFFALGGDSIKVIMLQKALKERDIEVSSKALFEARTPRALSALERSAASDLARFQGRPASAYPLTKAQMSIYLDCQGKEGNTAYNNLFGLFLPANMEADPKKLKTAVEAVLNRYPVFTAAGKLVDGMPCLVPAEDARIEARVVAADLSDRDALARSLNAPFDLENGPLARAAIFHAAEGLFLVLAAHHIVCDGTSMSILAENIAAAYDGRAIVDEGMSNLTLSQYEAEHGDASAEDDAIYRRMLDGLEGETELYSDDDPSLKARAGKAGIYRTTLFTHEAALSGSLAARLSERGLTESSLFMTAYACMLKLFCNQREVLFFAGENGRHDPALQYTVGMLVHSVPVLVKIDDAEPCAALVRRVQEQFHELVAHDGADFASLCGEIGIRPDLGFVYQGDMLSGVTLGGRYLPMEIYKSDDAMSVLTLHVLKQDDGDYVLNFDYAADRLLEETVAVMARTYARIVAGLCEDQTPGEIRLIPDDMLAMMDAANDTAVDYQVTDVVSMFRETAAKYPDHPAVAFKDVTLSYRELDDLSERIAGYLRAQGVGRGDVVSILIPRCEWMPTASLGVLKSGAAYQPLDPTYPPERLMFMMQDASCKLLIADEELLEKVSGYAGPVLKTRDIPALPVCAPISDHPAPEDLFILLYTSGSTGTPKGVMLEHRNLCAYCHFCTKRFELDENSRVSAYASFGFDANMRDTYPTLTTGGCVCIVEEEIRLDLLALERWFNRRGITHSVMTTQVGRQFYTMAKVPTLKYLEVGGEKLVPVQPQSGTVLVNGYGPSECTVECSIHIVDRLYERIPVGRALDNVKLYVVDEHLRRLPPLAPGELLISGHGVGRSYLNRPEQTAKAFIRNPFCDLEDYARAYRTGDVVRMLPSGVYDFIGRNDGQVKVRGFRIELTEVEAVIRDFPGISDATVQAFEDEATGEKFIAAYVVSKDQVDVSAMNAFIGERKPPYMVPAVTMQIDAIPLNQNHKVNKKALPRPMRQHVEIVPPQNETQQKVFDCVAEVLGHTNFGITTNIYEAGLSSIGMLRLNVALSRAFDVPVAISDLREHRTIVELEAFLSGQEQQETYAVQADYPLTQAQNGILAESLAYPDTTIYNIPTLFRLSDGVDVLRLKTAVEAAIAAHPCLNAEIFTNASGEPRVRRNDGAAPIVELTETPALPEGLVKPFDVMGGRLYRAMIYITEAGKYLFLDFHHIIFDGSSAAVFFQDIENACHGDAVEPETYTGFEVALDEERLRKTERYEQAKGWFDALLADADREMLPDGDVDGKEHASSRLIFDTALDAGTVAAFCKAHNLSENAFFNAAFAFVLSRFTGRKDALYTTIYSGRSDSRLARAVTMLVKTFPVMVSVTPEREIAGFASDLSKQLVGSMTNDIYGFAEIAQNYGIASDILFVYQGDDLDIDTIGGEKAERIPLQLNETKAPITLQIIKQAGSCRFECDYRSDRYSETYVRTLAGCVEKAAAEFTAQRTLGDVSLLTPELEAEIEGFNATEEDYPVRDIVSMFREAVEQYPDNTAVIFKDKTYTYRQADEISERIAHCLRAQGIGRGDVVSILIHRCEWMTLASLGVLKSGAAYQPLDPSYPPERLNFMMKDAGCKLLIADEALRGIVSEYEGPVLYTKDIPALPACEKLNDHPAPEDLFILLYTSGSTGVPKGVMLEHRNLANFCQWYRDYYALDQTCRVAAYASYGFDANMMDQYPALTTGACVCIAEEEIRTDLIALEAWYNRLGITHSFITTQVGRQFYDNMNAMSLRHLSVGGEKLVPVAPAEGKPILYNGYGPTECTIFSTISVVDRLYERVPIGKPLNNYRVYVVDENLRRLPPLAPGELLVAGRGVGRGYLNRPDLTEKAFIKNPFSDDADYARAYRTGDVVRLLPDGNIDFIGRSDGQVKVRGFRIELTEVESVIRDFPGIRDATVQAFEDDATGEKFIVAYVVSDAEVDVDALKRFIEERKPPYMVPAVTMQIPAIPLNQNQKVNKKALPRPERQQVEIVPPQNETQRRICDCLAEVLGHTNFGITTNIYEAGLSSIGAIRMNVLLSKAFDTAVSSKDLKVNDTVEKLEAFLSGGASQVKTFEVRSDYGLTKTQEGVYVESIARPDQTIYNIPFLLEISEEIDLERLRSAIVAAVNAHPILKTRLFLNDDGDVRMRRMDGDTSFDEAAIPVRDVEDIEAEKAKLVRPFKLLGGRLFRVEILKGAKTWLFLEAHHLVTDGSSMTILFDDISRAYAGETLEAERFTGYDVVQNEEELRAGSAYDEARAYYVGLLDDAETVNLPAGDQPCGQTAQTATLSIQGETPAEAFRRFCEENRCSMNGLFSAAFGLTLDKFLGVDAAVFAGIYSGRNDSRLSNTVAMLVKTLPIVVTQRPGVSTVELVREISRQLTDSQSNDIYSFAEISRALHVNADVMFAWQGDEFAFDTLCGKPAKPVALQLSEGKAPINLNVLIENGRISYLMEYRADRYSESWMRGFVKAVDAAVNGLIRVPKLEQVSILSEDAALALERFNDTHVEGSFSTAPERFLEAVKAYGDAAAVIARTGAERLSFRELGERAVKVAGALLEAGIVPGERVALYMDRTADVYAIRQGIMLAGGAFVSLEPEYPDDRIAFILKDAGIARLITARETYAPRSALFEAQKGLEVMELQAIYAAEVKPISLPRIDPDSPAYCIYTSGSTGNPKGVQILHRNLANLLHYDDKNTLARAYVDNSTRWLALAAITFDVSVIEEMMPMFHGRSVVIATQDEIHNPLLLMRMVKDTGVDMMKCTPSYLQSILDVPEAAEALKGLNALIVGAEPFPPAMYRRIREAGFAGTLFNSYGPTETCVSVCIGVLDGGQVNIGGPTLNTAFLIRDKFGNVLPPYARGELVIAGAQVGGGYVNLPEQTAEKFIWLTVAGREEHAYRSGDIAYFNGAGAIIHCGRNDNQVKIRGLRIELDGVENVMSSFSGIKRSVVLVKGEGDGKYLCGYYVSERPVDEAALIDHMKQTLTAYMIPSVFVHLTELPMTVNGKVNKKALPQPEFKQRERRRKAAANALQKQIADMFAKALGVDSVGVDEDFFEIGGTSMLASKVAMQAMVAGLPIAYQDLTGFLQR